MSFSRYTVGSPKLTSASFRAIAKRLRKSPSSRAALIPFPPPPEEALIITGKPMRRASSNASSSSSSGAEPGTTGTPASIIVRRASALSPMRRICSGVGPMKTRPLRSQISANSAFSARKP